MEGGEGVLDEEIGVAVEFEDEDEEDEEDEMREIVVRGQTGGWVWARVTSGCSCVWASKAVLLIAAVFWIAMLSCTALS